MAAWPLFNKKAESRMAKVISATGAKGLWSLLLRLNNMTPLSTSRGESPH